MSAVSDPAHVAQLNALVVNGRRVGPDINELVLEELEDDRCDTRGARA